MAAGKRCTACMRQLARTVSLRPLRAVASDPLGEDVLLQVTDGRGEPYNFPNPQQTCRVLLDQFDQRNAAGGHAGEVETVQWPAFAADAMTSSDSILAVLRVAPPNRDGPAVRPA